MFLFWFCWFFKIVTWDTSWEDGIIITLFIIFEKFGEKCFLEKRKKSLFINPSKKF